MPRHLGIDEQNLFRRSAKQREVDTRERTLSQDIHGVIDLDIHVIANGRQFVFLSADDPSVFTLDFPGRATIFGESASNDDGLAVLFGFVGFLSLILDMDGDFGSAAQYQRGDMSKIYKKPTFGLHE